jgi:EmrB/QacA subfamily drug resistance transporter
MEGAVAKRVNVRSGANPWIVLAVLCLGIFMALLDLTIVNVAIPSIIDGLHASLDQMLWALNAYSLVYAVLLITSGRVGDFVGPRNLFAAGVLVFTAASVASGMSHTPAELIAARAGQGLGAAMLSPQALPIITTIFAPERRGGAFAVIGGLSSLALVAGPTLGGFIVTHYGWQWVFYVNVPIGILTCLLALVLVPDLRPGGGHRLDVLGVVLATAGLFGIVFGLIEGQRYDWGTVWSFVTIPAIIAAGVVLFGAFVLSQALRQDAEPLLPFAVFRDRNYSVIVVILAATFFAMLGLFLPLTIYYQSVLGLSAQDAGLTIAVLALAIFVTAPVGGGLANGRAGKYILLAGLVLFAAGIAYIAWNVQPDGGRWSLVPGLVTVGMGMGATWPPAYSLATRNLRPQLAGVASGVLSTIQELGGVIASAAVGALLQNRLVAALHDRAVEASSQLPEAFRAPFVNAFSAAGHGGLEVGVGQTGGAQPAVPGLPEQVLQQLQHLAHQVFANAYVDAMRASLVLPVAVLVVALLTALAVEPPRPATQPAEPTPVPEPASSEPASS